MSEKAPGTPWKAITLSAAAGAFLLASDITCKLSPSRVRRRPGQRQDLGCEASVGQRRRGRESALSGCQQSPCPLQVGGSIDTQREGVNAGHIDPHAGLQSRSEEHTSELQSLMRISYAVFCLKKKRNNLTETPTNEKR